MGFFDVLSEQGEGLGIWFYICLVLVFGGGYLILKRWDKLIKDHDTKLSEKEDQSNKRIKEKDSEITAMIQRYESNQDKNQERMQLMFEQSIESAKQWQSKIDLNTEAITKLSTVVSSSSISQTLLEETNSRLKLTIERTDALIRKIKDEA